MRKTRKRIFFFSFIVLFICLVFSWHALNKYNKTESEITWNHVVDVQGKERSWLAGTVDGRKMQGIIVIPDETLSIRFNESLLLILGNASAVAIRYNGQEYPVRARHGVTERVVFPPEEDAR